MKTLFTAAMLVAVILTTGCASTPEAIAEYKARKPDRNSVAGWKGNPYLETWNPRTSVLPAPVAPAPESLGATNPGN